MDGFYCLDTMNLQLVINFHVPLGSGLVLFKQKIISMEFDRKGGLQLLYSEGKVKTLLYQLVYDEKIDEL